MGRSCWGRMDSQLRIRAGGVARRVLALPRVGSRLTDSIISHLNASGREVLRLTAYPQRPLPETVVEAACRTIRSMGHAPAQGLPGLRERIAARLTGEFRAAVSPVDVVVTNGAMDALNIALTMLLDPKDEVAIFSPCYFFEGMVRLAGGRPRYVPLDEGAGYVLDLDKLQAAISAKTKAILLTSPNNPTGHVATEAELRGIADMAMRRGLFVIADESYDRLIYDGRAHLSIRAVPGMAERALVVRSFTKSYSLSEWRVGYLVCPHEMVQAAVKLLEWRTLFNNYLSQKVAAEVLDCGDEWLADLADAFQRNRDLMIAGLRDAAGVSVTRPDGSPFLFPNIEQLGIPCEQFAEILLTNYGVPVIPGCWHQECGHFRIPFGGDENVVVEATRRIREAVEAIRAGQHITSEDRRG